MFGDHAGYPEAERLGLVEQIHGQAVADPYRWLEDRDDPRTRAWCAEQDGLFAAWRERAGGPDAAESLRRNLVASAEAGAVTPPVWRGERRFFTRREASQEQEALITVDTRAPGAAERVLVDPTALDPSGATTLDGWFPSREGGLVAYLLSTGGDERPLLWVMDVETGEPVDGPIERAHAHVAWLPGGAAFYYQAAGETPVDRPVLLHRVGTDPAMDVLIQGSNLPSSSYFVPCVSADGRRLRLDADWGANVDTYLADLGASGIENPRFTAFQLDADAVSDLTFGRDGRGYVLTDRDAENRRLCVVDLDDTEYEHWHTLLPADPGAVLKEIAILDGPELGRPLVLALRSRHALSELALHDLATGDLVRPVDLPGLGTVTDLREHPDGGPYAWFSYQDFQTPPTVYRLDGRTGTVDLWMPPPGTADQPPIAVNQVTYTSADGTRVGMYVLSPTGAPDVPRPAILYGYGCHGKSQTPLFQPFRLAWVRAGGVYAVAKLRGGGEEGRAWHRAGRRENKPNTFADFHAAGDYLVERGWTTRERLGAHGGSAGGQVVGVALAQRPYAYAAVLCSAPQLDMVRAELFGLGALWTAERGSAADPAQFGWLYPQSPYHLIRPGTAYPAVLLTVFENDARVDPAHARKFAAALQHATTAPAGRRPILLRRELNSGHVSAKRAVSQSTSLWHDQLVFFARQLGLAAV